MTYTWVLRTTVHTDFFICGKRCARSPPGVRIVNLSRSEQRENITSPTNAFEHTEEQVLTRTRTLMGNMGFDWQEWDASVGMSNGLNVLSPDEYPGLGKARIVVAFLKWEGFISPRI